MGRRNGSVREAWLTMRTLKRDMSEGGKGSWDEVGTGKECGIWILDSRRCGACKVATPGDENICLSEAVAPTVRSGRINHHGVRSEVRRSRRRRSRTLFWYEVDINIAEFCMRRFQVLTSYIPRSRTPFGMYSLPSSRLHDASAGLCQDIEACGRNVITAHPRKFGTSAFVLASGERARGIAAERK